MSPPRVSASPCDVTALAARLREHRRAGRPRRPPEEAGGAANRGGEPTMIGVAGAPGAGKSLLTALLAQALREDGLTVAVVPMDGFHLSRRACDALARRERRGAPDTFDADGFVALLRRVRDLRPDGRTVWAPCFDRNVHDPVAGDIPVHPGIEVVLVEGNYLLLEESPWGEISGVLDEIWYLAPDDDTARLERLIARHVTFGRTPEAARAHAEGSDEANARRIAGTAGRADLLVEWRTA